MATYIQSGTGRQVTDADIKGGSFAPGTFFIEMGTGRQLSQQQIAGTPESSSNPAPPAPAPSSNLDTILNNPGLSTDQKGVIRSIYEAVTTNDTNTAEKIKAAMTAATQYSDPYFKAQIRLATDALDRGLSAKEGDLAYQESSLTRALEGLKADTVAGKDKLSLDHQQDLKNLQTKYETDLATTQDNLAATGFTSSSKRARAEQILGDQNTGLVESSNRSYGYQTNNLDRTLSAKTSDVTAQIENYRRLASEGKLDLLRTTEEKVGSDNLAGYSDILGGVGGSIPRDQVKDALSLASNFAL